MVLKQLVNIENPSNSNGTILTDPEQIANAFNNFFVNGGPNTGKVISILFKNPITYL